MRKSSAHFYPRSPTRAGRTLVGSSILMLAGAVLLLAYGALLLRHRSFAAGGADSSGYLNSARGLREGRIVHPIESLDRMALPSEMSRLFIPLGFRPGPAPGTMAPEYPPGVPLHMAAAVLIARDERAAFFVSPISALGCLVLLYLLGRQLGLERPWALAGCAMLAAFPTFLFQALQPMSDVLATFWAMAAVLAAMASRKSPGLAIAAGAAFGIGVLVRPTNAVLLLAVFFALPRTWRSRLLFLLGGVPFGAGLLGYNTLAYGGVAASGYSNAWREFSLAYFPPRSLHYSRWTAILLTPLPPLLWLGAAVNERIPRRDRALLFSWFAAFFFLYSFYFSYDAWWYTRFLLPGVPAVVLGALLCGRDLLARRALPRRVAAALAGAALLVVLAAETRFIVKNGVHRIAEGDAVYAESSRLAERELPEKSLVLAMQLSGALEYDTEVPYVNWVWIEPGRFPEALAASAAARGYRWYALLAPFELEEARARLPGRWTGIGMAGDVTLWRIE